MHLTPLAHTTKALMSPITLVNAKAVAVAETLASPSYKLAVIKIRIVFNLLLLRFRRNRLLVRRRRISTNHAVAKGKQWLLRPSRTPPNNICTIIVEAI